MNDPIVGIDLGTSNSVVAHADETGAARVLADDAGYKIHPSVVSFHPNGGVVVGSAAKQRKVIDPKNTIYSVKRLIGRSYESPEVKVARERMPYLIEEGDKHAPLIATRAGKYAIPEISAIVLDHVRQVAAARLGSDVHRAVVTVPASFNDAQRSATATAGSIAGMTVVRVLNEPTAAALAYGHARDLRSVIAVYDFGGGTFDITILKLEGQVYEVLGTAGNSFLGGDDLDERLVDRMVEKFLAEQRVDLRQNEVAMMRLRAVAEQTKIELSRRSRALVKIDEIAYGPNGRALDLLIEIKRDEFVAQVADIIDRTFPVCEEALSLSQLTVDHIDDVILVGGTTKIPYVRDQVTRFFAKAPRTDVNPEEAVALGAALQANALERVLRRKTPSRAPVAAGELTLPGTDMDVPGARAASAGAGVAGPDSIGGDTVGPDSMGPTGSTLTVVEDPTLDRSERIILDEPLPAPAAAPPRTTAPYNQIPPVRQTQEVRLERPVERGEHHDRFEERAPTGNPTRAPTANPTNATPLARLTKPAATPPIPPQAVPRPVARTERSVPIPRPPVAPPPIPAVPPPTPAPAAGPPPRPLAPAATPDARTMILEPDPALEPEPIAAATAPGFPAPPPALPPSVGGYPVMAPPVVLDVTPRGLGIGTVAGFCEELIRRNSRVPTEIRKLFTTSRDSQDVVRIIVVQGESRRMTQNTVIGDLLLENLPPRPRGETSIEVTFALDASGILRVRARDSQTGAEQRAQLDLVGAMPQDEVEASRERLQTLRR